MAEPFPSPSAPPGLHQSSAPRPRGLSHPQTSAVAESPLPWFLEVSSSHQTVYMQCTVMMRT